jgi:SdpI/YfhL protein family
MTTLMILFTSSGLLLAAISVPLILGKIGPNPLYGFRVKKTLEDPAVWYPVNAYAAKRLLVVGLGISVSAAYFSSCQGLTSWYMPCRVQESD